MVGDLAMTEPLSAVLLSSLVSELARGGMEAFFNHLDAPPAPVQPTPEARPEPVSIIDLTSGRPGSVRATVDLAVKTVLGQPSPYWALFGIQAAQGARSTHFALYGDPVELKVVPGRYDLSALFLTKPASFKDKPFLVAMGSTHEVLASSRVQQVALIGSPPTTKQIQQLNAERPGEPLPFRLPGSTAPSAPSIALSPRLAPSQLPRTTLAGRDGVFTLGKGCGARDASGRQCTNAAPFSEDFGGYLCYKHKKAAMKGKYLVWEDGSQIKRVR
jgi:hypothetical protein